jgi:hypothetical protein
MERLATIEADKGQLERELERVRWWSTSCFATCSTRGFDGIVVWSRAFIFATRFWSWFLQYAIVWLEFPLRRLWVECFQFDSTLYQTPQISSAISNSSFSKHWSDKWYPSLDRLKGQPV